MLKIKLPSDPPVIVPQNKNLPNCGQVWKSGRNGREALACGLTMFPVLLDEDEPAAACQSSSAGGSGTGEWIEHDISRLRKGVDERRECQGRLFVRVKPVAGILPGQQV